MIINLGDAPFKAFIKVTYPNGTCTVSLGDKSFTHSGGGTHTFTVNKKGTWTVRATSADGYNLTAQSAAALTYRGQVASVTLSYRLDLYNAGDECPGVTGGWVSTGDTQFITRIKNATSFTISTFYDREGGYVNAKAVNLTTYKRIYVRVSAGYVQTGGNSGAGFHIRVCNSADTEVATLNINGGSLVGDLNVDVSNLSGLYTIKITVDGDWEGDAGSSKKAEATITHVWLTT